LSQIVVSVLVTTIPGTGVAPLLPYCSWGATPAAGSALVGVADRLSLPANVLLRAGCGLDLEFGGGQGMMTSALARFTG
jgi:hypothetical protein